MNELESKMNENQRFKRRSNDAILDKLRDMHGEMGALLNHKCFIIAHYQECGDCREYNRLDASYTKWCLSYVAGIFAKEKQATFPQSSSLVPEGAESADIGKLDTADKNTYDESTDFCAKLMASSLAPVRTPQLKSGVEMGKVNRVPARNANDPTSQSEGETAFYERLDDMIEKNGGTMPEREDEHE